MHIHILGIGGTFMGSLAQLAKQIGITVTGCDQAVYSPMREQLQQNNIDWVEGYESDQLRYFEPDIFVIGNTVKRGIPLVESILSANHRYTSGPQFLADYILVGKWVLACAGTHGKTTTASMLTKILEYADYKPGYLIGGVPFDFEFSACLGDSDFFVLEADEYDSAFFDKRSKFIHYRPQTLVINNLEFDHADIFANVEEIQKQFHHLIRCVSSYGKIIVPSQHRYIEQVLDMGSWTPTQRVEMVDNSLDNKSNDGVSSQVSQEGTDLWQVSPLDESCTQLEFRQLCQGKTLFKQQLNWQHGGKHNGMNALCAVAAAQHVGIRPEHSLAALEQFKGVKRRMELLKRIDSDSNNVSNIARSISIYDDFAHHPTAIKAVVQALRHRVGEDIIIAVIEPRSNTMKMGIHKELLADAVLDADYSCWYQPATLLWSITDYLHQDKDTVVFDIDKVISVVQDRLVQNRLVKENSKNIHIVIMSNGDFYGLHDKLIEALESKKW